MKKELGILVAALFATGMAWAQQPLGITRVLLYKNGMAYIERSGQITAPVSLTFHPEDMNDVLKSFTAWNPVNGNLYSVGYTAGIPTSHMLTRFPFDISGEGTGLGEFLIQVKGADVRLDHGGKAMQGKLVAVQRTDHATAPQTVSSDYRLTVMLREGSLQTMWLSDVRSVEFVDPQLRDQLRSYLEVLAAGRQDVTREVSVYPVPAPGPINVAYLQQFPLWKTSYRIDLGAKESRIQGWAQIDNPTGEAWENVTVSLLSGAPVSFVMNLYDPLYTRRTTVAVPGGQVAAPRQYESALARQESAVADRERSLQLQEVQVTGTRGAAGGGPASGVARGGGAGAVGAPPAPPAPAAAARGATQVVLQTAEAARVEDFYEYKFPFPVRIASRQSALLPFLQKTMNIEKLSIFNARADQGNPRLGARLENNTDIPFESGPVTFFQETRYAGEAVLDYLPRGEKALVSFGVDNEIQIGSRPQSQPETTVRVTVSKGVAVLFMESVLTTTYEIRNKGTDRKMLIIEHPRLANRELKGIAAFETTEGFHRFRVPLGAGQATTLPVAETVARQTSISLSTLNRQQLALFAGRETPQAVRDRLGQIVDTQEQIARLQSDAQATRTGLDSLYRDQERLRENLKALGTRREQQQLRARYLEQLRGQEDQIDAGRARVDAVNQEITSAQARLGELISNLTFGG